MKKKIKVLVAPLDWGIGHATRCIPVIRELLAQQAEVVICASGNGKTLLTGYFQECKFIDIPGIAIHYPVSGSMALSILRQLPGIVNAIKKENRILSDVISKYKITHVISDNRYGLFNDSIRCSIICHQVKLKTPPAFNFLQPLLYHLHKKRLQKFHELWIPDNSYPENLSGELSYPLSMNIPVKYTGTLSRFTEKLHVKSKTYDYIAIISGPEPQRSLLENKLLHFFKNSDKKSLLIAGIPGENKSYETNGVTVYSSITDSMLKEVLHSETTLICRPGYSTLMDLTVLGHRKIIFIPTPGQTEQEYLGSELKSKYDYVVIKQGEVIRDHNIQSGKALPFQDNNTMLQKTIRDFLS